MCVAVGLKAERFPIGEIDRRLFGMMLTDHDTSRIQKLCTPNLAQRRLSEKERVPRMIMVWRAHEN